MSHRSPRLDRAPSAVPRRRPRAVRLLVALVTLAGVSALLPVPPASAAPPVVTFTATLDDTNRVTLAWTVSGGDSSNLLYIYEDIGFKPQDCTPAAGSACSHVFRVPRAGVHRYTLSVKNNANENTTVTREVTVNPLTRPTVASPRVHVDMFNVGAQTLNWSHPAPVDLTRHYVKLRPPGSFFDLATEYPVTGSYTVPANQLGAWTVRYCTRAAAGQTPICSAGAPVTYVVEPAQFTGDTRRFVPTNQALTLSWSGAGTYWHVSSPTLSVSQWTNTPSITIPAAQVVAGTHKVKVISCVVGRCSNREDAIAPVAGTVHHLIANGQPNYPFPNVAEVTPTGGGAPQPIAPGIGTYTQLVAEGASVTAGTAVGYVLTQRGDDIELVAGTGPSVATFTNRNLATDFTVARHDGSARPSTGAGLDVTFDSSGAVWELGEFGTAAARIQNGVYTHFESPVGRAHNPNTGRYEKTKPFDDQFSDGVSTSSAFAERIIDTGSAVWWAHGGGYGGPNNHSRLTRFDRNGTDNPATPDDDRLCAVHVPGVNNVVIGLAHDPATNRIWFTEKGQPNAVSWFVDGSLPCNNALAYQQWVQQPDPDTIDNDGNGADDELVWVEQQNQAAIDAAADANLCDALQTTGCIHRIPLSSDIGNLSHLVVDSASGSLWMASYTGSHLSKFPLNGTQASQLVTYPLPNPVRGGWFLGYPWQIRVDTNAVYLVEYADNQLLRFDKAKAGTLNCTTPPAGTNPCISEVFLPMAGAEVNAHSIALRNGKLWFTMAAEGLGHDAGPNGSYIGYVDLASWTAGAPTGVIYNDLASLGAPSQSPRWSIRGIEAAADGRVALAEMHQEIVVLTPK